MDQLLSFCAFVPTLHSYEKVFEYFAALFTVSTEIAHSFLRSFLFASEA